MSVEKRTVLIVFVLAFLAAAVYWPVGGHSFITLDDEDYVTSNPHVLGGLTRENVSWAFTTFHATNWHPLTWLSHMADVDLFGTDAGWHHRVNLLLHLANTLLLFFVLRGMTGAMWRSGFAAALFAVHPLHVESVAWVSERKDLLCALFWLLATGAYWRYAVRGGGVRYLAVTVFFLLGLLSKPMIVTLPFVFLLLDYWPLGRVARPAPDDGRDPAAPRAPLRRLLLEKVPWALMSLASSVVTLAAQQRGGTVGTLAKLPAAMRVENAVVSYGAYLWKVVAPSSLSIFYPHPARMSGGLPAWQVAAAAAVLATLSVAAWRWRRTRPYLVVGWLFYLGTLLPVIGLVQVGMQAMADRYMYLPLVGVAIVLSWGSYDLARKIPWRATVLGIAGGAVLVVLSAVASVQVSRWSDSITLFRHALSVTSENPTAWFNLADALTAAGEVDEAARCFAAGLRYWPDNLGARHNMSLALARAGRYAEAAEQCREILKMRPDDHAALVNLGVTLERLGRDEEAVASLRSATRLKPDFADAYTNLGAVLLKLGRRDEAVAQLRQALRLNPADPVVHELMRSAMEGRRVHP